jgi:hypothetical protein
MTGMTTFGLHARTTLRRVALAAALLLPVTAAGAQDFAWNGTVARGNWVRLRNTNGEIHVESGAGDRVEITAIKRASRGGDTSVVRIEARQAAGGGDLLVCALWGEGGVCEDGQYRGTRRGGWDGDDDRRNVSVEFRVKLPAGVRLDARSVNGEVNVSGATSEVRVQTVNGSVSATSSGGPVRAKTVNGSIDVRMATLGSEPVEYETVNGSVTVRLPQDVNAEIEMSTVNGSLESDFPLTLQGRMDRRNIRARLCTGGPRLSFSTVNGSVELRRM